MMINKLATYRRLLHSLVAALGCLAGATILATPKNLAAGKEVRFAPAPNYRLTKEGDSDSLDLTDGRFSERPDKHMWFESHCVGYSYPGLANLVVDLETASDVGAVVVRFQGGSPQPGICAPGWIHLYASDDGEDYRRIASYSRWTPGDQQRFQVPQSHGKAWIHPFRFADLDVRARYIGLSFYGAGVTVMDEMQVFAADGPTHNAEGPLSPFAVRQPQLYFHKPVIPISAEHPTPVPVGLILPPGWQASDARLKIHLPPSLKLNAGSLGGVSVNDAERLLSKDGADGSEIYQFPVTLEKSSKTWGRLYMHSDAEGGSTGQIQLQWTHEDSESPAYPYDFRVIELPRVPRPQRLLTGLGWWSLGASKTWPDALNVFQHLGFNTVSVFARWLDRDDPASDLAFLENARQQGFRILNIDSPFHHMLAKHKQNKELYAQFEDGTVGTRFCPSYRGPLYDAEIERLARETALVKASYLTCDIELWNWRGPVDSKACTRCQKNFVNSGIDTWEEWRLQQGEEIWQQLATAVKTAVRQAHAQDPSRPETIDIGGYDFRPGHNYQHFWPFDRLYPAYMDSSQVSTYTPLHPYHLELVGDRVRQDRQRLPESDVLPWLTPGDAGTFPGDAFYHVMLECFANGARGSYFWSGRVWDAESLAAYARAIRAVAPAETIILEGVPAENVRIQPDLRVSAMRLQENYFLLAANYRGTEPVPATLTLPPSDKKRLLQDTDTGEDIVELMPGQAAVNVTIPAGSARPLLLIDGSN